MNNAKSIATANRRAMCKFIISQLTWFDVYSFFCVIWSCTMAILCRWADVVWGVYTRTFSCSFFCCFCFGAWLNCNKASWRQADILLASKCTPGCSTKHYQTNFFSRIKVISQWHQILVNVELFTLMRICRKWWGYAFSPIFYQHHRDVVIN